MPRFITLLLLVMMLPSPVFARWEMSEFMIFLWGGPSENTPAESFAAANFNTVMCVADQLDLCRKYGLKGVVMDATPEMAAKLTEDNAVWGYYVRDEPWNEEQYQSCAQRRAALHQADPNHPGWVNLGGSYQRHKKYIETVQPEVLSYDYYQWWWERKNHFTLLEDYRAAAQAAGIPLICWVEANANPDCHYNGSTCSYLSDNAEKIRQSVYTSLAYGVKGIEWFVGPPLIFRDAKLTQAGEDVAAINAELKRLGPILIKLRSVDVFHTAPLPANTRPISPDYWVQAKGRDLTVGMFKDATQADYIMVTNQDYQHRRWAVLQFGHTVNSVAKFDKSCGKWSPLPVGTYQDGSIVELIIGRGDGELLRVE